MAERIPFVDQQATGLDELAGAGREAINVVVDGSGSVRRRPGLALWCGDGIVDGDGLDSIYATVNGDVYAFGASPPVRQLYAVTPTGFTPIGGVDLLGMERPVIAETESILVFAAGQDMTKLVFSTNMTSNLGGPPPQATHIIANSSRLLANDVATDKTKVWFSGAALGTSFAGFEQWTNDFPNSGFFTAESRPDPVLALAETTNEVYVFGTTTVQVWGPDANAVFVPLATQENGLAAPYSIVRTDASFAYLDHRRRFVIGDGRGVDVISDPIQSQLDGISSVSDCYGFRVKVGPCDALVWTFPSDQRTYVFQKGAGWGQWTGWDEQTGGYARFPALAVTHNPITNETLAGLSDGRVGVFRTSQSTDIDTRIPASVTTGFINRGTNARKHCNRVRIAMRRGQASGTTAPVAFLRYRDRPGAWESPIPISLGASTDTEVVLEFPSLGTYRRRQWRFEFAGTEELVLTEASEEFEVLGD